MRWDEIKDDLWLIPAARMKMKRDHIVPLVPQTMELLDTAKQVCDGSEYAFHSPRSITEPIAENSLNVLFRRAGLLGIHCPHGWRATFRTIMKERRLATDDVLELMLAHAKDKTTGAYDRAQLIEERREAAGRWAGLLMEGMPAAASLVR